MTSTVIGLLLVLAVSVLIYGLIRAIIMNRRIQLVEHRVTPVASDCRRILLVPEFYTRNRGDLACSNVISAISAPK
jgi:hypothetical protein